MDGNGFGESTMLGNQSDSLMDMDCMDELLLEGCWLETSNVSEFSLQSPSSLSALFEAPFPKPALEASNGNQEERQRLSISENLSVSQSRERNSSSWEYRDGSLSKVVFPSSGSQEMSRRWWIGPNHSTTVMERLFRALNYIKEWSIDKNVLIQVWIPVNKDGKRVLTTSNQPFSTDDCQGLKSYREISVKYQFPTEEGDSRESVGFPGRVFMGKVPEWTPDVQYFQRTEYPRVRYAQQCDVRGALGVPIFEQGSRNCLGVIEVLLTTQKVNYRPELKNVCNALKAVDLQTSDVSSNETTEVNDFSYDSALREIRDIFREACGTYNLPLAQAWVSCTVQGKGGCRHHEETLARCVSTVDSACFIADPRTQGFNEACSEHHLLKGQGIVGRAFTTNQPCFSPDVSTFTKKEYPLSHHARMFELSAAVAIRLRSIYSSAIDFVLEFFLPVDCKDSTEQMNLLSSLSLIIHKVCQGLRVITDEELQEETFLPVGEAVKSPEEMPKVEWISPSVEVDRERVNGVASELQIGKSSESLQYRADMSSAKEITFGDSFATSGDSSFMSTVSKNGEKRRAKPEKTITLEILRQYFAGSLKDAAKSIGVCPTTLKRICRTHGIKRWPSRKIKKVGHSLQKIQRVIDSVEGASGSLQIGSFYTNFPELKGAPNSSPRTDVFPSLKSVDHTKPLNTQPLVSAFKSPSSSCSHSSSSSQCNSSGMQPQSQSVNLSGQDDPAIKDGVDALQLKRVRSDAQLHLSNDGPKPLVRSQSHIPLVDLPKIVPFSRDASANTLRIKVTYGEEKVRFRMVNSWRFEDLLKEISRRFSIEDFSGFLLKYLDDDSEWILLTCDADLEECIDVYQSAQRQTIKLSLTLDFQQQHQFGSSSGRTYLLLVCLEYCNSRFCDPGLGVRGGGRRPRVKRGSRVDVAKLVNHVNLVSC